MKGKKKRKKKQQRRERESFDRERVQNRKQIQIHFIDLRRFFHMVHAP